MRALKAPYLKIRRNRQWRVDVLSEPVGQSQSDRLVSQKWSSFFYEATNMCLKKQSNGMARLASLDHTKKKQAARRQFD